MNARSVVDVVDMCSGRCNEQVRGNWYCMCNGKCNEQVEMQGIDMCNDKCNAGEKDPGRCAGVYHQLLKSIIVNKAIPCRIRIMSFDCVPCTEPSTIWCLNTVS